ncbi:FAD-dependent oxidoreductase [Streptomyces sp. GC420]|uniref:FAD-dependent oxidoreductase n=1 Tax=Streptomyces sp. GC420 TaxID=2697568 RepID=UPI0014152B17|nr:FAD-dependent oxidoreductase [Streptomyces sp. GC420]NBM18121.1 oxidoreductase [Streptomyces sp. GC420]
MSAKGVDLVVVGAGPAGVAAALMADSLGLRATVVEADRVAAKPAAIGALANVPGGWADGAALARALRADVERLRRTGRCALVTGRVVRVAGYEDRAEAVLADGRVCAGGAVVVATGVEALAPSATDWITAAPGVPPPPPLWRAVPDGLAGRRVVVLGGDRPLGTWLRSHPGAPVLLHVLHPAADAYKAAEAADDTRVRLEEVERVTLRPGGPAVRVEARHADGSVRTYAADLVLGNLGGRPAAPEGLVLGPDGHCPPTAQHPRVLTAGDVRAARFQRIGIAMGSGAEAVLTHYYGLTRQPGL